MKRIIAISTIVSGIICCFSLVLFPVSYYLDFVELDSSSGKLICPHSFPVAANSRCTIFKGGIWLFSDSLPYTGSLIGLHDSTGGFYFGGTGRVIRAVDWHWELGEFGFIQHSYSDKNGKVVRIHRGGDLPGFYYRHFEVLADTLRSRTMRISLLYPILFFAFLPVVWLIRFIRGPRKGK